MAVIEMDGITMMVVDAEAEEVAEEEEEVAAATGTTSGREMEEATMILTELHAGKVVKAAKAAKAATAATSIVRCRV